MPPSGYDRVSLNHVPKFLTGTAGLLAQEVAAGKWSSLREGVAFEARQISEVLNNSVLTDNIRGILLIKRNFYVSVLKKLDEGILQDAAVEQVCDDTVKELMALHIDEDGNLVERSEPAS